jgi:hypothetical protein
MHISANYISLPNTFCLIKAITNTMSYTSIGNAPWVRVAEELYPLVQKIGKLIAANSTDYIAQQTYWLEIRNNNGVYEWRFFSNDLDKIVFDSSEFALQKPHL